MTDMTQRLNGAIASLKHEFQGLRTGRPSPALLENITVDAYGSQMPMLQVGSISASDRTLTVNVWDKGLVAGVEKAIKDSGLGLNPAVDGSLVRVNIPPLTEDRRKELLKVASRMAEEARVAIRNIRRDLMDDVKKQEKEGLGEDDAKREMERLEDVIKGYIKQVDELLAAKEKDVMTV